MDKFRATFVLYREVVINSSDYIRTKMSVLYKEVALSSKGLLQ